MNTSISYEEYEQLAYDVDELRAWREKVTKAVQDLHALVDDGEFYERYPRIVTAVESVEALL